MIQYINKTSIGYSHIKNETVCQDYSASYHDEEKTIITACDGHGGKIYIRSQLGSKFASKAIMKVFHSVERTLFYKYNKEEIENKLKLEILCEWNAMVEQSLSDKSFTKKEMEGLTEEEIFKLKVNPAKAYGTTLNGAMVFGNKLICVNLGDGGVFALKKGELVSIFTENEDDETVANLTYSMCNEDAFNHLKIEILDFNEYDGVIVCTDGLVNPYQNLLNFTKSFVKPITIKMLDEEYVEINNFIERIGSEIGIGDDVSFSMILKSDISQRNYKR